MYISHRGQVGILLVILLLLIGIISWFLTQLFFSEPMIEDSIIQSEITQQSETVANEPELIEVPLVTDLHFVEDSSFLDLTEVFNSRSNETDREHYYTLLANPGMMYEEAYHAKVPELPQISWREDGDELVYRVEFPQDTPYDVNTISDPLTFDAVVMGDITVGELFASELVAEEKASIVFTVQKDIERLAEASGAVYSDTVTPPEIRLFRTTDSPDVYTGFQYPAVELVQLFVYEKLLGQYIDSVYYNNGIDEFITTGILNQNYLQSDVIAAQVLADQYLAAAAPQIEDFLVLDQSILEVIE